MPSARRCSIRARLAAYDGGLDVLVEAAMANPALPVEDMHRILDEQIRVGI